MLSTVIFWSAIVAIVSGAFFGLTRGFARSFLRFFTVLVSFIVSAVLCTVFIEDPERLLGMPLVGKLLSRLSLLTEITEAMPEQAPLILSLPAAMFSPLLFFILFAVISGVLLFVYGIAAAFIFPKDKDPDMELIRKPKPFSPFSHVLGMLVGACQGVLTTLALLIPFVGMSSLAVEMIDTVRAEGGEYRVEAVEIVAPYRDQLVELQGSVVYSYGEKYGGRAICNALMQYEIDHDDGSTSEVALRSETLTLTKLYAHSFPLQNTSPKHFGQAQAKAISMMASDLSHSEVLSRIAAAFLSSASAEWKSGESFLSIEPFTMAGELSSLPSLLYDAFDDASVETVRADLATLSELIDVLSTYGVFALLDDGDALLEIMTSNEALADIVSCLRANPRTASVANELLEIAFRVFKRDYLVVPTSAASSYGAYREMLSSVAATANGLSVGADDAARLSALADGVGDALATYGVESDALTDLIVEAAAREILGELGDRIGSISADDIAPILAPESEQ